MSKALPECPSCSTCDYCGRPSTTGKDLKVLAIINPHACNDPEWKNEDGTPAIFCECRCHTLWQQVQAEKIPVGVNGGDGEALT